MQNLELKPHFLRNFVQGLSFEHP